MTTDTLLALQQAAKLVGRPLRQHEIDAVNNGAHEVQRVALRQRFINVIAGAGYKFPEPICDTHFDDYMKNIPEFIKMMEDYERNDFDPE